MEEYEFEAEVDSLLICGFNRRTHWNRNLEAKAFLALDLAKVMVSTVKDH